MTVQFPAIRPSERELTPAVLPQARVRTESRRVRRWALANDDGGATVALTFTNITDDWAESIRQTHSLSLDAYDSLLLPPELWADDPDLEAFLAGAGAWRFAEPPQFEWQKRGRVTATVRLVQKRRDALPGFNPNAPPLLPWIPPTVPNPGPVPPLGPDGPDPPEPPAGPDAHQFWVSETTTAGASLVIGGNSWIYSQSMVTAAGSIYWTGRATAGGTARYFLMKYDSDGFQLWARWLEGDYSSPADGAGNTFSEPVMCEGPIDGVFVGVKGMVGGDINQFQGFLGSSMRIHLFTTGGVLTRTAAWAFADNGFGRQKYNDEPAALLYQPAENKLYVAGLGHSYAVLPALTLDEAYGVRSLNEQGGTRRIFWSVLKQRVVIAGSLTDSVGGFFVREFSPDMRTQYQAYAYATADGACSTFAMDASGAVYGGRAGALNAEFWITKLSASDDNYTPLWERKFAFPSVPSGIKATGALMDFMPDGRLAIMIPTPGSSTGSRDARQHVYVLSDDQSVIEYRTTLVWAAVNPWAASRQCSAFDLSPTKEIAAFVAGSFSLGVTTLRLPAANTDLLLASTTSENTNSNKNMTGFTDYTDIPLTAVVPTPSKAVLSASLTDLNPMVAWAEAAWSTSDLATTVNHITRSTGPLQIDVPLP
jgi:hypothetical protein